MITGTHCFHVTLVHYFGTLKDFDEYFLMFFHVKPYKIGT